MTLVRALVLALAVGVSAAACSSPEPDTPALDLIPEAIAAVEERLGGPQRFFEVNAGDEVVNLFVAADDLGSVTGYLYSVDGLLGPAPSRPVESGWAFAGSAVDYDPDLVLDTVFAELDDPEIEQFVLTAEESGAVRYEAIVRSERGGVLVVGLSADGRVLSVVPR